MRFGRSAARRLAHEYRTPAGSIFRRSGSLIRTTDQDSTHVCVIHVHLVIRNHTAPLQRLRKTFRLPLLPDERYANHSRTRFHRYANFQPRVASDLHVGFPLGRSGKAGLTGAGPTGRGGPALRCASDGETFQQLAIQANVEPLRPSHTFEVILILPLNIYFYGILSVD